MSPYIYAAIAVFIIVFLFYLLYCASCTIHETHQANAELEHNLYTANADNVRLKAEVAHLTASLDSFAILEKFSTSMVNTVKSYEEKIKELEAKLPPSTTSGDLS